MNKVMQINNVDLPIKEWQGKRVVTFKDIDRVHERPDGTAKRNFAKNKKYFIESEDYFIIQNKDVGTKFVLTYGFNNKASNGILLTESGYLMIVKSFTDNLAWKVQRELVNSYFKLQEIAQNFNQNYPINVNELNTFLANMKRNLPCVYAQINNIEESLEQVIDNLTISTRQQEIIHEMARKRINHLLGGAHSIEYKTYGRMYMINLWNGLKSEFHCGSSYKDLNPKDFDKALDYIKKWKFIQINE